MNRNRTTHHLSVWGHPAAPATVPAQATPPDAAHTSAFAVDRPPRWLRRFRGNTHNLPLCGSRTNLVLLYQLAEQVKKAGFAVVADVVDVPQT